MIKPLLSRAKYVDEPYVRHRLELYYPDSKYSLLDVNADWEHVDIDVTTPTGYKFKVDVKRNLPKHLHSPNFTFVRVRYGKEYPLDQNGYFAYIDDLTGDIYMVPHTKLEQYWHKYRIMTNIPNIQYIVLPKADLVKDGITVLKGNEYSAQYLQRNADPNQFYF